MQQLEFRVCSNNHKQSFRIIYKTGDPESPVEAYLVCKKCIKKPHYEDLKHIISKEEIK